MHSRRFLVFAASALVMSLAACGGNTSSIAPMQTTTATPVAIAAPTATPAALGLLATLSSQQIIGSTIDPVNGDQNPYGLAIAPVTAGVQTQGDLVVCNFNDKANVQGNGTSIVVLHPAPGSQPIHMIADPSLKGCSALVDGGTGNPWVAAYTANDNPIVKPSGSISATLASGPWNGPWGQAFSATAGPYGTSAFYSTNAGDGSIVRIDITSNGFVYDKIATGFSVNHGMPGNILAPAGLAYVAASDTLYIVDSNANRLVALNTVSSIPPGGVVVSGNGFTGPNASSAKVIYAGAPLNAPISSAVLVNGDIAVGNTGDNRIVEITAAGVLAGTKVVDPGAPGAIFGMVATGTSAANQRLYFNNDNTNMVVVLSALPLSAATPTAAPTATPTATPTTAPTATPTAAPTTAPTATPTPAATAAPTTTPIAAPSASAAPTATATPYTAPYAYKRKNP